MIILEDCSSNGTFVNGEVVSNIIHIDPNLILMSIGRKDETCGNQKC